MDFWFRFVDFNFTVGSFGNATVKAYVTLDLRTAWHPYKDLELSLAGQNFMARKHLEYINENQTLPTAIDRRVYSKISWKF
jgi:iron complex outermembrane receptor protein